MTVSIQDMLEAARPYYEAIEARSAPWYPAFGNYAAAVTKFEQAEGKSKDGTQTFLRFFVEFTMTDEHKGRVIREMYDTQIINWHDDKTKEDRKDAFSLQRFKNLALMLNDGQAPKSVELCIECLEAMAAVSTPVTLKVYNNHNKKRNTDRTESIVIAVGG